MKEERTGPMPEPVVTITTREKRHARLRTPGLELPLTQNRCVVEGLLTRDRVQSPAADTTIEPPRRPIGEVAAGVGNVAKVCHSFNGELEIARQANSGSEC